jgi:hypothetical protein
LDLLLEDEHEEFCELDPDINEVHQELENDFLFEVDHISNFVDDLLHILEIIFIFALGKINI